MSNRVVYPVNNGMAVVTDGEEDLFNEIGPCHQLHVVGFEPTEQAVNLVLRQCVRLIKKALLMQPMPLVNLIYAEAQPLGRFRGCLAIVTSASNQYGPEGVFTTFPRLR